MPAGTPSQGLAGLAASDGSRAPSVSAVSRGAKRGTSPAEKPMAKRQRKTKSPGDKPEEREADPRPESIGMPLIWSITRQGLCETLDYYRAHQGAAYTNQGRAFALMLGKDQTPRIYMNNEVVITRSSGHNDTGEDKVCRQVSNHSWTDSGVKAFVRAMEEKTPIVLLASADASACPIKLPHSFNVLGWFAVADVWMEKNGRYSCCKYRFQKLRLDKRSWWAPKGTANPSSNRPAMAPLPQQTCTGCQTRSKTIFRQGWVCLNDGCGEFWTLAGGVAGGDLQYSEEFLNYRDVTLAYPVIQTPFSLRPPHFQLGTEENPLLTYSIAGWGGFACMECGCCSARKDWFDWTCQNEECEAKPDQLPRAIISAAEVQPAHALTYTGPTPDTNTCIASIERPRTVMIGNWNVTTYTLTPGNSITHFRSNKLINEASDGPDFLFKEMQRDRGIGLQRFGMPDGFGNKGPILGRHFSSNFGMPYKYIMATESNSFDKSTIITKALERMNWAGGETVKDGSFGGFNEVLAVGYYQGGKMNYHDDGETDLGPTIATVSLGGPATMTIRMKQKYLTGFSKKGKENVEPEDGENVEESAETADKAGKKASKKAVKKSGDNDANKYHPEYPLLTGSLFPNERIALNRLVGTPYFNTEKDKLWAEVKKDKSKTGKKILTLNLQHGDMIVMHGAEFQKYYEHMVTPSEKLRFALTCRWIDPARIDIEHHHLAERPNDGVGPYDGSIAIPNPANFEDEGAWDDGNDGA